MSEQHPYCFAKLDIVFPMGDDGLRHTPESCFPCHCKTECLRTAMKNTDGLKAEEERLSRAYSAGMIGFFRRWSRQKDLHRKITEGGKQGGKT